MPLQNPPTADLMKAHKLLGYIKNVLSTDIDAQVGIQVSHGDEIDLVNVKISLRASFPLSDKCFIMVLFVLVSITTPKLIAQILVNQITYCR